jgi:5'-3' exonuclease
MLMNVCFRVPSLSFILLFFLSATLYDATLHYTTTISKWVEFKMQTDDFWKYHGALNVIVSGPDVPGEGEHKVMDFLRQQQQKHQQHHKNGQAEHANSNNVDDDDDDDGSLYQPNYTHVLYGLDADLIMLGLVTHEPNFLLLREKMSVVMAGRGRNNNNNRGRGGGGRGGGGRQSSNNKKKDMLDYNENDFEVLELSGLRQMLALQFQKFLTNKNKTTNNKSSSSKEAFDLTRIVDDFVFMCMLVGNDFLPHAPHLEIDAGAISLMMSNYMDLLGDSWGGGYLTHKERIHPQRLEEFIYCLAAYEEEHFKRRGYEENEPGWKLSAENEEEVDDFYGTFYSGEPTPACAVPANVRKPITGQGRFDGTAMDKDEPAPEERPMEPSGNRSFRRKHPDSLSRSYRDFYYDVKMGWKPNDRSRTLYRRRTHVRDYLEGLHWCLNYYHNGCPSWNWYFPYLYSPLCTDMVNLHEFYSDPDEHGYCSMKFDQGEPFPSLAQLLSVLPPQSADLLPNALAELMLHTSSPLKSFYPPDFTTDPNGKRQSWEAVVEIPFINADVLLETVQQILNADAQGKELLSNAERRRNLPGRDHVFRPNREDAADQEQAHKRAAAAAAATTATAAATTSPAAKRRRATAPKQQ